MPESTVTNPLREAQNRINEWSLNNPLTARQLQPLDLSGIGLTNEHLQVLMPELIRLQNLETLLLNKNNLSELPNDIAQLNNLIELNLSNNELMQLPPGFWQLNNLSLLDLRNNHLAILPGAIRNLTGLQLFSINNNLITDLPIEMGYLRNLVILNVVRNPLSVESLTFLQNHLATRENITLHTESESAAKLKILYPAKSPEEIRVLDQQIGNLKRETPNFRNGNEQTPDILSGDEVVDITLQYLKASHGGREITQFYHNSLKHLLERALSWDTKDADAALTQMAAALGNCPTPIGDLLEKTGVQLVLRSGKKPSRTLLAILHRQAFEELILTERIVPLSSAEQIEIMQGLTNTLFMAGSETNQLNPLQIEGERPRINPKTENIDFAFTQLSDAIKDKFAKVCCKTDESDNLIEDSNGKYFLDPDKYYTITEKYVEKQGILDTKARARKAHIEELKELIKKPSNRDLAIDLDLVDFNKIEDKLRLQMRAVPDEQIETIIKANLYAYKLQMERVREEYALPGPSEISPDMATDPSMQNTANTGGPVQISRLRYIMNRMGNQTNQSNTIPPNNNNDQNVRQVSRFRQIMNNMGTENRPYNRLNAENQSEERNTQRRRRRRRRRNM